MAIKHVLLIPREGDLERLLKGDQFGARPPMVFHDGQRWRPFTDNAWWWPTPPETSALVLAWEGRLIPEGCDRAWRTFEGSPFLGQSMDALLNALSGWKLAPGGWPKTTRGTLVYLES